MRGDLAKREPEILAAWKASDLYGQIQTARAAAPAFVLHDGPPYSNGHIHYGHILNKILKDLVVKHKTMMGMRAPYIPGWDTHGLPIELAVERELGPKRRDMTLAQVRQACRDYALKFVDIQRTEFQLGVFGVWAALPDAVAATAGDRPALPRSPAAATCTAARSRSTGARAIAPRWPRPRSTTRTRPRRRCTCGSR
jgi:leucyl-tRNA synthetase